MKILLFFILILDVNHFQAQSITSNPDHKKKCELSLVISRDNVLGDSSIVINFNLEIFNISGGTVNVPGSLVSGPITCEICNIIFEIKHCTSDSSCVFENTIIADINSLPSKNGNYLKLYPGNQIKATAGIPVGLLKHREGYFVRFIFRKKTANNIINDISGDIYSEWVQLK